MTAHRRERQGAILRLIRSREISTQAELADALREAGHEAVQTTVSRDIAELGLVKVRAASGRLVYAPAGTTDVDRLRELELAFRRWALSIAWSWTSPRWIRGGGPRSTRPQRTPRATPDTR